jgi:hypothetical protein
VVPLGNAGGGYLSIVIVARVPQDWSGRTTVLRVTGLLFARCAFALSLSINSRSLFWLGCSGCICAKLDTLRGAAGGEHLGYRSVVRLRSPSSSPACFSFSILHIGSILLALPFVSHILPACSVRSLSPCRFAPSVAGRSYCPLLISRCFPNIGHIVPSQCRKSTSLHLYLTHATRRWNDIDISSQNRYRSTTVTPQLVLSALALPAFGHLILFRKGRPALSARCVACLQLHLRRCNCKHGCCCGKGTCDASSHFNTSHTYLAQHFVSWHSCRNSEQAPASVLARSQPRGDTTSVSTARRWLDRDSLNHIPTREALHTVLQ